MYRKIKNEIGIENIEFIVMNKIKCEINMNYMKQKINKYYSKKSTLK